MKWNQIKTLFILIFLLLDIYLLTQFFQKQEQVDLSVIERQESTIEEQLMAENIKIGDLPEKESEESYISVRRKAFTADEEKMLHGLENQKTALFDKNFIVSKFDKAVSIPPDASTDELEELVKGSVLYPEEYEYWNWNKETNVIILFQKKNDRPVYYNQSGLILIYLNEENEMIFYTQTMLGEADSRAERKSLIKPIKAIETLYKSNELHSGDEITKVDIGFHTRAPLANGVQVFVPTWKISVKDEQDYFVNAIEGWAFSNNEIEFLEKAIITVIERVRAMSDEEVSAERILNQLNQKLEVINGGEAK